MIVFVESNFVLEIAMAQEESSDALTILGLGEETRIHLAIPAFGLSEPFSRLRQRSSERRRLAQQLEGQRRDLARSRNYDQLVTTLENVTESLSGIEGDEMNRLLSVIRRILKVSDVIPITEADFADSTAMQDEFDLSPQDALVLSGVVSDLKSRDPRELKCYVSRDAKAFSDPGIRSMLDAMNCRYLARFSDAVNYIRRFAP